MRDFLLFLALMLSLMCLVALAMGPSGSDDDAALAELSIQVEALHSQNDQLRRLILSSASEIDALSAAFVTREQDLDALLAWSQDIMALLSPPVGEGGATYDCDDATLDAFRFYTERGYPVCILAGNLALTDESMERIDHVWLLVRFQGGWLPVDWGQPANDRQHFEGYRLEEFELREAVRYDWVS